MANFLSTTETGRNVRRACRNTRTRLVFWASDLVINNAERIASNVVIGGGAILAALAVLALTLPLVLALTN